jgi:Methyltransferase domain
MRQRHLKNYLEIGVLNGHIFFRIKSSFKVAVDPQFIFDNFRKAGKLVLNPYNLCNQYFEKTSDDFFALDAPRVFAKRKIELALIDGMHEYAFALRDVENTLHYGADRVVAILHDCNPLSKDAALSYVDFVARDMKGVWNGDVWKAILHIRSLRPDLTAFVLDCDHGLGFVVKKKNEAPLPYTAADIGRFTYEDLNANRDRWLGLQTAGYFYEFFGLQHP